MSLEGFFEWVLYICSLFWGVVTGASRRCLIYVFMGFYEFGRFSSLILSGFVWVLCSLFYSVLECLTGDREKRFWSVCLGLLDLKETMFLWKLSMTLNGLMGFCGFFMGFL